MIVLYQGMVLEAEDAAKAWLTLSKREREEYKLGALAIAQRERPKLDFWPLVVLAFYSFLVFHNFLRDLGLIQGYLDSYVAIIFKAVVNEEELSKEQDKFFVDDFIDIMNQPEARDLDYEMRYDKFLNKLT